MEGSGQADHDECGVVARVITALPPRKRAVRGLRRTFQQGHTPRDLTVGGYLALSAARESSSVAEALDWFSLPPAPTPIPTLDVGSRRILEVCGALISRPRVALLDEPTAGLAGPDREDFVDSLAAVTARLGVAVLLIEHDIDAVLELCDSVAVLDFGKLIATGSSRASEADRGESTRSWIGWSGSWWRIGEGRWR